MKVRALNNTALIRWITSKVIDYILLSKSSSDTKYSHKINIHIQPIFKQINNEKYQKFI